MRKLASHFLVVLFAMHTVSLYAQSPEKPEPGFTLAISQVPYGGTSPGYYTVLVRLTNKSNEERRETDCAAIHGRYSLSVVYDGVRMEERDTVQKLRKQGAFETCKGDLKLLRTKPGESQSYELDVTDFYDMSKPGTYQITATKETFPGNPDKSVTVKSNTLSIVVPEPEEGEPK
jgi:hypothetical protein